MTRGWFTIFALLLMLAGQAWAQTYLGLDRNDYPGKANMAALRQTFSFTGYWLNNPPGGNRNTWRGTRKALQEMGYGFLLLFNGREYQYLKASGNAARIGTNDAATAVQAAQREDFPKKAIIFLDQEQGGRMLTEQRAYIHAWVDGVVRGGYRAGIYCSGIPFRESSTVPVVTANDIREHAGGREIHFFASNDQCGPSPGCAFPNPALQPAESGVTFAEAWQFARVSASARDDRRLPSNLRPRWQLLSSRNDACFRPSCRCRHRELVRSFAGAYRMTTSS